MQRHRCWQTAPPHASARPLHLPWSPRQSQAPTRETYSRGPLYSPTGATVWPEKPFRSGAARRPHGGCVPGTGSERRNTGVPRLRGTVCAAHGATGEGQRYQSQGRRWPFYNRPVFTRQTSGRTTLARGIQPLRGPCTHPVTLHSHPPAENTEQALCWHHQNHDCSFHAPACFMDLGRSKKNRTQKQSRRPLSHAPQTRFFIMSGRLRDPAQSIACKDLPIPPLFPRLRCSDLSVGQPVRRYRASKKQKMCLQAVRLGSSCSDNFICSLLSGTAARKMHLLWTVHDLNEVDHDLNRFDPGMQAGP